MKRIAPVLICSLAALLLSAWPLAAQQSTLPEKPEAKPAPPSSVHGYVSFGGAGNDRNDYAGRVSEFTASPQGGRVVGGGAVWGNFGLTYFDFRAAVGGDGRDQDYWFNLDAHRWWRTEVRYSRLPHRLDHDPLDTLDAAKGAVVVRHDDMNPAALYAITRGELEINSKFTAPQLPGVEFRVGFRDERREGHTQARTMSKCANCHVVGQTRGVDQVTQDLTAGVSVRVGRFAFHYDYLNRNFEERAATPTTVYDLVMHPSTQARVFDNRIQYQLADGPLPFNQIPEVRKESHSFRASVELPREAMLNLNFVKTTAENEDTGLSVDSKLWSARFGMPLGKRLFLTARFRQMQIQGDNLWIDVVEPLAIAGPQLGLSYADVYTSFGSADYLRESEESRRPMTADFELAYRLAKRTTLRAGYRFDQVKRDHFEVYKTTKNAFRVSFTTRTQDRKWSLRAKYQFEDIDDPFMNVKAAYSPVIQPFPAPGAPPSPLLGTQYYVLYDARQADLTALPTRAHLWEYSATWSPNARVSLSSHLRWRRQTNDDLNMSDWDNSTLSPGGEIWFAPHPKFSLVAGYYYHRSRGETLFVLPVFDG